MLKVVVFGTGRGGEMFAEYVEEELAVVDVIRELHCELESNLSAGEARVLVEAALHPHIGKVEVIVLASYEITLLALGFLRRRYPDQKFVGFTPHFSQRLGGLSRGKKVMMLASDLVRSSSGYCRDREELERLEVAKLVESECRDWIKPGRFDLVLMYSTDFHGLQPKFEEVYGWQVKMVDGYGMVFRETCAALGLRGMDGGRGRSLGDT